MLKSTQGMIVTFLVVMNKSIPPRIFFQLLSRFPLTCAKNPVYYYCCAGVAQLVEQLIRNQQVAGSSPATSSMLKATFNFTLNVAFIFALYSAFPHVIVNMGDFFAEEDTHNFTKD